MYAKFCFLACVAVVFSLPSNRDKIPNGRKVPDPCHSGQYWQPVGHLVSNGQLANFTNVNAFGKDFLAAKGDWSALCGKDSDGDGIKNGEELGDPKCTWSVGGTPDGVATGHPGIDEKSFDCSGIIG